jgi:hypothetical protein
MVRCSCLLLMALLNRWRRHAGEGRRELASHMCVQGDKDRNGRLDSREIHEALRTGGFNMSYTTSHALFRKYDTTGYGLDMAQWIALVRAPPSSRSAGCRMMDVSRDTHPNFSPSPSSRDRHRALFAAAVAGCSCGDDTDSL